MMLNKLAYRNAKRSIKDYLIYLITMAVTAALMFAFHSLIFTKEIMKLYSDGGLILGVMIGVASVFIVFIISWLIHYMVRFMLEKRSREFGTYLLMGFRKKQIARLFMKENLLLAAAGFLIGLIPGMFFQQILTAVFYSIFGRQYEITVSVSGWGLLTTVAVYGVIYFFALLRNKRRFKKMNIHDLIYLDRQNEKLNKKQGKLSGIFFIVALVYIIIYAVFLFDKKFSMINVWPMTGGLIGAVYLFYTGFASMIVLYVEKRGSLAYRGTGLFLFRQMASKVKTMRFTMGTLTVLFAAALCGSSIAMMLSDYQAKQLNYDLPFDVIVFSDQPGDNFKIQRDILEKETEVTTSAVYCIYENGSDQVNAYLYENLFYFDENQPLKDSDPSSHVYEYFQKDTYMKLSDYNRLRKMLGYESVTLKADEYLIQTKERLKKDFHKFTETKALTDHKVKMKCRGISTIPFSQNGQNGADYVLVVPDQTADGMTPYYSLLAADIRGRAPESLQDHLADTQDYFDDNTGAIKSDIVWGCGTNQIVTLSGTVLVRDTVINEAKFILTAIAYPFFYIGIIFLCAAMTILSVQQLSDASKYQFRYQVLQKLGLRNREIRKVILKQLVTYYLCPMAAAVVISGMISIFASQQFVLYTGIETPVLYYYGMSLLLFIGIYLIYFTATYIGFKKNAGV